MQVCGIDFTSSPSNKKPITLAIGELHGNTYTLHDMKFFSDWSSYEAWLSCAQTWIAGFDHPFGLPRELVEQLGWPTTWSALMEFYASCSREEIRTTFRAFCDARPVGKKFAHRACDLPAGSSPAMKWVNPPVAYMLKEGAMRLLRAGVTVPLLHKGDARRIALEAYPGYSARLISRQSYKSDNKAQQNAERQAVRAHIVAALEQGQPHGITLVCTGSLRQSLIDDPMGDQLDAVLCAIQAAYCWQQRQENYGFPLKVDPLEGWIATVPTNSA